MEHIYQEFSQVKRCAVTKVLVRTGRGVGLAPWAGAFLAWDTVASSPLGRISCFL